ncbi:MAG: bacillithiol system redox-active protein YtxJ [Bacteroidia bacterium]|nr:bacillithiol system redox-active protein YtxJ [Bacteroidia bacterium]MBT8275300.1 bacillithiol system redox-active protein YtxJ [Bacteroidia bacterium]NNF30581.1 bacillithiol system redox-active protein YtxJ [Flavobacteriaceae bacterium]NNK53058.1 bacillithiol system redox-active protein YtxJ [Flavobacteriaceae bacterium]NNM09845.1 bacillithiol system redox-active protein YtxJ [Flavobacteriaceae bacterium]
MGLFGLFGSKEPSEKKEKKEIPWDRLTRIEQLDEIVEISKSVPVAIFKHSTSCGISRMALRQFEGSYDLEANQMRLFYLDLLSYREVSNEVSIRFQVIHQSPQLIVIKNGIAVHSASHHGIMTSRLQDFI